MIPNMAPGAIAGLRVIDLSRVLGGPYCTQILADHGADVVKVEPPAGDETRDWGPPFHDDDAAYFIGTNRNKRSIGLDLASEAGRVVLMRMLEDADVMIENFKPGTLDKWGIGNDVLRAKFPKLIHCRISGFGGDGPHGGHPGYDAVIQSMVGLMASTGTKDSGPTRIGVALVDMSTGLYACVGILMALAEREKSGLGQFVEATLYETGLAIMHPHTANYFMNGGKPPARTGNEHPNLYPYAVFAARDGDIFVGVGNDVLRAKFPRLVHARISGFGADGPRGGNPGYDAIIQAMTGMIAATGSPQSGPMRIGVPLVDITTGLYAAIGILMALSE
ncbi:MAG: CoA transferase, partial [Tardiphaga sp.]